MDLKQPLSQLFQVDQDGFIICTGVTYKSVIRKSTRATEALQILHKIINVLGQLSSLSQGLKQVITNITRFSGTHQRIYIKVKGNLALGFIKIGQKNLFHRDFSGHIKQLQPTCVLDFYVHESSQRSGFGKLIFDKFLQYEQITAERIGYDRPSHKLLSFLQKHYQLSEYIPQNNNYVIFDKFFTTGNNSHFIQAKKDQTSYFYNTNRQRSISSLTKHHIMANTNENMRDYNSNISLQRQKEGQNKRKFFQPQQSENQEKMVDSLEAFTQQIQKTKNKIIISPQTKQSPSKPFEPYKTQKSINPIKNYHMQSDFNTPPYSQTLSIDGQSSHRYSLSKKLKDLSYKVPWAISGDNLGRERGPAVSFRTTSNTYGIHYQKK